MICLQRYNLFRIHVTIRYKNISVFCFTNTNWTNKTNGPLAAAWKAHTEKTGLFELNTNDTDFTDDLASYSCPFFQHESSAVAPSQVEWVTPLDRSESDRQGGVSHSTFVVFLLRCLSVITGHLHPPQPNSHELVVKFIDTLIVSDQLLVQKDGSRLLYGFPNTSTKFYPKKIILLG